MYGDHLPPPGLGQVSKFPIRSTYQRNFLLAPPALDLLLARNRYRDVFMLLKVQKPCAAVFLGKAFESTIRVLKHTYHQVTCHADVQRATVTAHDVGVTRLQGAFIVARLLAIRTLLILSGAASAA